MGLGNSENDVAVDDGEGGGGCVGGGGCGGKSFGGSVSCSICLEVVADAGDRSWAKLQCGHQFHLDCIGSAFNAKGAMQCPNCRKIEKGQWLYANGYRSLPESSMDDWTHDEDLYDLTYSEMSFGVHWCPFGGLARLPSSFEEGDFSSNGYHDLMGQHAFVEHTAAVSSAAHPCPYIAYFGPVHPSSSNSSGSVSDGSNYNNHWNGPSAANEIPSSFAFPTMDLQYHSWEHHASPFSTTSSRIASADQPSIPPLTQRSSRNSSDFTRSGYFVHPFVVGHSSSARAGSSSVLPPYQGSNARARDRVQALQAYYQQPQQPVSSTVRGPVASGARRSSHRALSQVATVASSSDQSGFHYIPSGTSGRSFQEAENPPPNRFRVWERDHPPSFTLNQVDRDSSWGTFHQATGASETGIRSTSLRQRQLSERMSSQNR